MIALKILGAQLLSSNLGVSVDELCGLVYDEIKRKLYLNVVKVMLENKNPYYMKNGVSGEIENFINEAWKQNGIVSASFKTDFTLVGIGAPIHIFLDDVAKMLGAKTVVPKYSEVANAIGAVAGNVCASHTVDIKPNYSVSDITGYTVFGNDVKVFENLADAEEYALSEAKNGAYKEAVKRGARGEITVTGVINPNMAQGNNVTIHLNTLVKAQAVGAIGF